MSAVLMLAPLPASGGPITEPVVGPGYFATDNVEWLANILLNTGSAGARILDGYLYVTEDRGLTIYDISNPELPVPVGFQPLPQTPYFTEEDVDTNGEILLIGSYGDLTDSIGPINNVFVIDVSNKSRPSLLSTVQGADNHTISCILDCTWAYGSSGALVDLRDPANPVLLSKKWTEGLGISTPHDITEVAPGLVVTSSRPLAYLDVADPPNPKVIATASSDDNRFIHGNGWPNEATDDFLLVGGETSGNCNTTDAGAFMTFKVLRDEEDEDRPVTGFEMTDQYRLPLGLPTEGYSRYDQYCAHWFTEHPTFEDGGLVAMGWYEHGTRFLNVSSEGKVTEVGYFLPVGGSTSAAYWVTDEILYAIDYQRGIDILKFHRKPSTGEARHPAPPGFHPVAPRPSTTIATDGPRVPGGFVCPVPV